MKYELFLWLKPNLAPDQVKKEIKGFEDFLLPDGKIELRNLGKKKLSYKIKGFEEGIEMQGKIDCPPGKVQEFKTMLNRNEAVLRYLLIKLNK